jgi:hypothetical protein
VITYRAMLDVPRELVGYVSRLLRAERRARGTRTKTRALTCWYQALFVLVWLRKREDRAAAAPGTCYHMHGVVRGGERLSIQSLVHGGHFALIAGKDGQDWVEAAGELAAKHDIPLRAVRIGLQDVDLVDVRLAWLKNRGITASGVVLVRPDGHIAFRSLGGVDDPSATQASVFGQIMAATIG